MLVNLQWISGCANSKKSAKVFPLKQPHDKDEMVKFIDFSNDGYKRMNRKKANNNLKDTGNAKECYEELLKLVRHSSSKLKLFTKNEYYENTISLASGSDWNQTAPIDTKPTLDDFKKTVGDYLAWEVSNTLKQNTKDDSLGK